MGDLIFRVKIGSIYLVRYTNMFMIEQPSGEAMEVSELELARLLDDYYAGNF